MVEATVPLNGKGDDDDDDDDNDNDDDNNDDSDIGSVMQLLFRTSPAT